MRLHRVQQHVLNDDLNSDDDSVPSMKGALGRNAIGWMKIYFNLNYEVMPTSGRLHLCDNCTRREVYDAYGSDMISQEDPSPMVDIRKYRQLVGSLIFLCNTRPDICFAVGVVS